ncbi:MAG: hypothetical protein ACYDAK_12255 [Candidatus Limnocylindrales bacterium]
MPEHCRLGAGSTQRASGILLIALFVLVPLPLRPLLTPALVVVVFLIAAALGLWRGIVGAIFGRR